MTTHSGSKKALVLTVGTGNIDDIERTLLVPVLKSVEDGEWDRIVLLPSHTTEEFAQTLQERISNPAVEIDALPTSGQENDADACFGHFDSVLVQLIDDGFKPGDIVVDFTRGTKAMSAAVVLAALGRDIPVLRYVYSERRDERGTAIPGIEKVGQIKTNLATERRRLYQAERLMGHGNFSAVIELLPHLDGPFGKLFPAIFRPQAASLRAAAQIYAAWDRLDYKAADKALEIHGSTAAGAGRFAPTPEMGKWLRQLARRSDQSAYRRALACDLLANAERRLRDQHFEDALLRAYRGLELIDYSAGLPPQDAKMLKGRRNRSILIHGFTATIPSLRKYLADLERLLQEDDPKAGERLIVARSLDFSQS